MRFLSTLLQGTPCGPLQLCHLIHFIAIARWNFQNGFLFEPLPLIDILTKDGQMLLSNATGNVFRKGLANSIL